VRRTLASTTTAASSSGEGATVRKRRQRPHLRSIDRAEMMMGKRRSRQSFELAGGSVFAAASELGDGAACSATAEALRLVLANGEARRGAGETNRPASRRVASSCPRWPDPRGQRRRTASTWRARPDGGRPRLERPKHCSSVSVESPTSHSSTR